MTSMDFGLIGLDMFDGSGKMEEDGLFVGEMMDLGPNPYPSDLQDILSSSIEQAGLLDTSTKETSKQEVSMPTWNEDDTDDFLKSMLTGSDLSDESSNLLGLGTSSSDSASDSGVSSEDLMFGVGSSRSLSSPGLDDEPPVGLVSMRELQSPGLDSPQSYSPSYDHTSANSTSGVDLIDYISNDSESADSMAALDCDLPLTADPVISTATGTTTIILPAIRTASMGGNGQLTDSTTSSLTQAISSAPTTIFSTAFNNTQTQPQQQQINFIQATAGGQSQPVSITSHRLVPREATHTSSSNKRRRVSASSSDSGVEDHKYPKLELSDEEKKMAVKEGMVFPKYYPLTREEERNLKKIRRKIRNKLSAQDSRKRKREYLDSMEDRVKACTDENMELKAKIKQLETKNRTLAAQLRRIHQMVANGGLRPGGNQTSTALMVLVLSAALFLIPGVRDQTESKSEIDIQNAVKMPPLPGQSRSLLQFNAIDRNTDIADLNDFQEEDVKIEVETQEEIVDGGKVELGSPLYLDHDYAGRYIKPEASKPWIDEDEPPLGYGSGMVVEEVGMDRQMNVNVTSSGNGTRTVVLQIPKDIK